jgi:hypothetical protein
MYANDYFFKLSFLNFANVCQLNFKTLALKAPGYVFGYGFVPKADGSVKN